MNQQLNLNTTVRLNLSRFLSVSQRIRNDKLLWPIPDLSTCHSEDTLNLIEHSEEITGSTKLQDI
jgi:hypothetical protein